MSLAGSAEPARAFSPRSIALMLLVGVGAFVGLVALTAYAPELSEGDNAGHALSRSAIGFAGLAELLKDTGVPVVVSRGPLPAPDGPPGLMILTPGPEVAAEEINRLEVDRPVLVVAPKWSPAPSPLHKGWVGTPELLDLEAAGTPLKGSRFQGLERRASTAKPVLKGQGGLFASGAEFPLGPTASLQTAVPSAIPLLTDAAGRPVLLRLAKDEDVYLLTDPDLLNNQGLRSLETARTMLLVLQALRGGEGPVVFDVTLNGFGRSRSLLRLALGPPFLGATLCALAAALLMGAHAAARFGAPRRPERALALGKRALVDNAAVLIRLARREPKMGARYAALTRRVVAQSVAAGPEAEPERIDAALDRLTPEGEAPFSSLLAAASQAADEAALMQAVRRLHQRRLEMTRERL